MALKADKINSGEELEQLVKLVEDILLPKGFTVTPRKRVYNEKGVQIAELDLLISGKLSTTQINWLIECRDRPSDGPAEGVWIEQLVGRRDRFKLDKVTAVSTTGFSEGAIGYAQETGIELRAIEQITPEQIENWFSVESINFYNVLGNLIHSDVEVDNAADDDQIKELREIFQNLNSQAPLFINTSTGRETSIVEIWQDVMNQNPQLTANIEPDQPPKRKVVKANFPNPQSRYKHVLQGKDIHILRITFIADITVTQSVMSISKITKYHEASEGQSIAESVHFDLPIGEEKVNLAFHRIDDVNGTVISVIAKKKQLPSYLFICQQNLIPAFQSAI